MATDGCNTAWTDPDPSLSPHSTCREPSSSRSHFLLPSRAFLRGNAERLSHRRGGEPRGRPAARAPRRVAISSPGHLCPGPGAVCGLCPVPWPRWPLAGPKSQPGAGDPQAEASGGRSLGLGFAPPLSSTRARRNPLGKHGAPNPATSPLFLGHPGTARLTRPRYLPGWPSPASNCWWLLGDLNGHSGLAGREITVRAQSNASPSRELRVMGSAAAAATHPTAQGA